MDIVKEIHKNCGGEIESRILCVYPPIEQRRCNKCGKVLSSKQGKIIEVEVED